MPLYVNIKESVLQTRFVKIDDSIFFFLSFAISDSRSNLNTRVCCSSQFKESYLKGIQISETFHCFALSIGISFCSVSWATLREPYWLAGNTQETLLEGNTPR